MKPRFLWASILATASLVACGGDDKNSSSSSGGSSSGTTTSSSGGSADSGAVTPKAAGPKLTDVLKMTGGLHVVWELPSECGALELERKDGDGEFAVKYKLPGTVDNKHDATATDNLVYTYRARCNLGSDYTEYSNEMGKNPQQ